MVLEGFLLGLPVDVHLEFAVIGSDGVGFGLFVYPRCAGYYQLPFILQKLTHCLRRQLLLLVSHHPLQSIVYFIEIWHFGFGSDLFDRTFMTVPERINPVQRLHMVVIGQRHLKFNICIVATLPWSSR